MKWILSWVLLALILLPGLSACVLQADREIVVEYVYLDSQATEVTIRYRVPAPSTGKVYVLWLLNLEEGKRAKAGTVQPSDRVRALKVSADFHVTGVVVSIENSQDVPQMSNTWALKSGRVTGNEP
ncbi:MAG: hypothetical protein HY675_05975 [Chloroflexi bacterium]|nr:hypothetical protein [Chloroflexota bacterium]